METFSKGQRLCISHSLDFWLRGGGDFHIECGDCMEHFLPELMINDTCFVILNNNVSFRVNGIYNIVVYSNSNILISFFISKGHSPDTIYCNRGGHYLGPFISVPYEFKEDKYDPDLIAVPLSSIACVYKACGTSGDRSRFPLDSRPRKL